MFADRLQAAMTATMIAVAAAVGMRTHIGPVVHLVTTIVTATTAVTPATIMHRLVASTATLRQDVKTVTVAAAMTGVADIMREMVVVLVNMPKQGLAREKLVTEEALSAEVESTKIVLSMIDIPVDNCDR
jgi:hypothetical protein